MTETAGDSAGPVTVWRYEEMVAYPKGTRTISGMAELIGRAMHRVLQESGGQFISGGCGPVGTGATVMDALKDARHGFDGALEQISHMHRKIDSGGGMTSGECAECSWQWPCPTYHVAQGWGDSYHDCAEQGWCEHEAVPLERPRHSDSSPAASEELPSTVASLLPGQQDPPDYDHLVAENAALRAEIDALTEERDHLAGLVELEGGVL